VGSKMARELIILSEEIIPPPAQARKPAGGNRGSRRTRRPPFIGFLTVTIRNRNTRMAYALAVKRFFDSCDEHHLGLEDIEPIAIAG
jgi:hypothetical protein